MTIFDVSSYDPIEYSWSRTRIEVIARINTFFRNSLVKMSCQSFGANENKKYLPIYMRDVIFESPIV